MSTLSWLSYLREDSDRVVMGITRAFWIDSTDLRERGEGRGCLDPRVRERARPTAGRDDQVVALELLACPLDDIGNGDAALITHSDKFRVELTAVENVCLVDLGHSGNEEMWHVGEMALRP